MVKHLIFLFIALLSFIYSLRSQTATRISDINPSYGNSFPYNYATVGNELFFTAKDALGNRFLYKTDGTLNSTSLLKSIEMHFASPLIPGDSQFFFFVDDQIHGKEPWISDGTSSGTHLLKDIVPGTSSSGGSSFDAKRYIYKNGLFYFWAIVPGLSPSSNGMPWVTDGTASGTYFLGDLSTSNNPISSSSPKFTSLDSIILFSSGDLWRTNSTKNGTYEVIDLDTIPSNPLIISELTSVGNEAFFLLYNNPGYVKELWKTDGTKNGTIKVKDLGSYSKIESFINVEGTLFFSKDGELWKSDGTSAGTKFVYSHPYWSVNSLHQLESMISCGGYLYFQASNALNVQKLHRSDGTTNGTVVLPLNYKDPNGMAPTSIACANSTIYFKEFFSPNKLAKTDGTIANTALTNASPTDVSYLTTFNNKIAFGGAEFANGHELYIMDCASTVNTIYDTVCEGESVAIKGKNVSKAGLYRLSSSVKGNGCYSISNHRVVVNKDLIQGNGIVSNSSGNPISKATIVFYEFNPIDSSLSVIDTVVSDNNGNYSFGFNRDSIVIKVLSKSSNEFDTYYHNIVTHQNGYVTKGNCTPKIFNIQLIGKQPLNGTASLGGTIFRGSKLKAGNIPVTNEKVFLLDGNIAIEETITNSQGYFRFNNLSYGNYSIWIDKPLIDNDLSESIYLDQSTEHVDSLIYHLQPTYLELVSYNGIDAIKLTETSIYPNPSKGHITIQKEGAQFKYLKVSLKSTLGQELRNWEFKNTSSETIFLNQPSGLYIIEIKSRDAITTHKILLK